MAATMWLLTLLLSILLFTLPAGWTEQRCSSMKHLENGRTFFRYNGLYVTFACNPGFRLHGHQTSSCKSGRWSREPPLCVGSGCPDPGTILHGSTRVTKENSFVVFACDQRYRLVGSPVLYCRGKSWNSTNPVCRESDMRSSDKHQHLAFLRSKMEKNAVLPSALKNLLLLSSYAEVVSKETFLNENRPFMNSNSRPNLKQDIRQDLKGMTLENISPRNSWPGNISLDNISSTGDSKELGGYDKSVLPIASPTLRTTTVASILPILSASEIAPRVRSGEPRQTREHLYIETTVVSMAASPRESFVTPSTQGSLHPYTPHSKDIDSSMYTSRLTLDVDQTSTWSKPLANVWQRTSPSFFKISSTVSATPPIPHLLLLSKHGPETTEYSSSGIKAHHANKMDVEETSFPALSSTGIKHASKYVTRFAALSEAESNVGTPAEVFVGSTANNSQRGMLEVHDTQDNSTKPFASVEVASNLKATISSEHHVSGFLVSAAALIPAEPGGEYRNVEAYDEGNQLKGKEQAEKKEVLLSASDVMNAPSWGPRLESGLSENDQIQASIEPFLTSNEDLKRSTAGTDFPVNSLAALHPRVSYNLTWVTAAEELWPHRRRPTCPYPPLPAHGTFYFRTLPTASPTQYRHFIQYACYPGYTLAYGDVHSYCLGEGKWSGVTPVCLEDAPCSINNGGCSQLCSLDLQNQKQALCSCRLGFQLLEDNRTCRDTDECVEKLHGCQQECVNTFGSFRCLCGLGFLLAADGRTCTDGDECAVNNGGCAQHCANSIGSYSCFCSAGFQLAKDLHSCEDIDECLLLGLANCSFGCINTIGSFCCQCPEGYPLDISDVHCQDIDECAENDGRGLCSMECQNVPGSFCCSCSYGYTLAGDGHTCLDECPRGYCKQADASKKRCTDVDECVETGPIQRKCEWRCVNLPGSHRCICPRGYHLDTNGYQCKDVNECQITKGGCSHICINYRGGYKCACPHTHRLSPFSSKQCRPTS